MFFAHLLAGFCKGLRKSQSFRDFFREYVVLQKDAPEHYIWIYFMSQEVVK